MGQKAKHCHASKAFLRYMGAKGNGGPTRPINESTTTCESRRNNARLKAKSIAKSFAHRNT
jgi:hypothetical protein